MSFLDKILEVKKTEVRLLRQNYSYTYFSEQKYFTGNCLSFRNKLLNDINLNIICEIKKASPSKGVLLNNFDHLKIAGTYFKHGVDAISILTDKTFFQGSIKFLQDIAKIKTVPLLRKDFIIDEYQILEAKAAGADIILLISEALNRNQIADLTDTAIELGMNVLVELHSPAQLDKLDFSREFILGINNRHLETFMVDIIVSINISSLVPVDFPIISESGINSAVQLNLLKQNNFNGISVGEYLMKAEKLDE